MCNFESLKMVKHVVSIEALIVSVFGWKVVSHRSLGYKTGDDLIINGPSDINNTLITNYRIESNDVHSGYGRLDYYIPSLNIGVVSQCQTHQVTAGQHIDREIIRAAKLQFNSIIVYEGTNFTTRFVKNAEQTIEQLNQVHKIRMVPYSELIKTIQEIQRTNTVVATGNEDAAIEQLRRQLAEMSNTLSAFVSAKSTT